MGKEIGTQLQAEILYFDAILKAQAAQAGLDMETVYYLLSIYDLYISDEYKDYMTGVAETSGLSYNDVLMQICWMDLYYGMLIPMSIPQLAACTAIGTEKTVGQTFDLGYIMQGGLSFVDYTLLSPGTSTVFSVFIGAWTYPMGKNSRDVMIVGNLLQTAVICDFGIPISIRTMMALETSRTTEECKEIMLSSFTGGYNYIISDRRGSGVAIQTIGQVEGLDNVDIEDIETAEVRTNTYLNSEFAQYLIDPSYSIARQAKAEELADEKYQSQNKITTSELIDIFQYNDGTDASICRYPDPTNPVETATLAYISMDKHQIKFGIGLPGDNYGRIWM
jgi:hypothetical protein